MKLTSSGLRKIIAEEVAEARKARRPTPATPEGSFEDFERGAAKRVADRRWADLSRKFPKLTKRVGRDAFDREWAAREEGAAGGGGHLTYADEFRILLDLLEEEA